MIILPYGRVVAHVIFSLALVAGCPLHCSDVGNQVDCAGRYGASCEWDVDKSWKMPKRPFIQYTPCRQRGGGDGHHGGGDDGGGNGHNHINLCKSSPSTRTSTVATTIAQRLCLHKCKSKQADCSGIYSAVCGWDGSCPRRHRPGKGGATMQTRMSCCAV